MTYIPRKLGKRQFEKAERNLINAISSLGNPGKLQREIWTTESFLKNARVSFEIEEIKEGGNPPDIYFREAKFEVKEVLDLTKKRSDEYGAALKKLRETGRCQLKYYKDKEIISPEGAWAKFIKDSVEKAVDKYRKGKYVNDPIDLGEIDLLIYFNHGEYQINDMAPGSDLLSEAGAFPFRSISIVGNGSVALVLKAEDDAPSFIRKLIGKAPTPVDWNHPDWDAIKNEVSWHEEVNEETRAIWPELPEFHKRVFATNFCELHLARFTAQNSAYKPIHTTPPVAQKTPSNLTSAKAHPMDDLILQHLDQDGKQIYKP